MHPWRSCACCAQSLARTLSRTLPLPPTCLHTPLRAPSSLPQVAGCQHDLCFGCARRLCASQDHAAPQCPFCRQAINGFQAIPNDSPSSGGAVACSAAATAPACIALRS
jgi:hypothetical protein